MTLERLRRLANGPVRGSLWRLCLVLSLWHAPVPWIHIHRAEASDALAKSRLTNHLLRRHAVGDEIERETGWHWHLVLPRWCVDGARTSCHECADDEDRPVSMPEFDDGLPAPQAIQVSLLADAGQPLVEPPVPNPGVLPSAPTCLAAGPFLDTFLDTVSMRALIGVARC